MFGVKLLGLVLSSFLAIGNNGFVDSSITNNLGSNVVIGSSNYIENLSVNYSSSSGSGTIKTVGTNNINSHNLTFNSNTNLHCTSWDSTNKYCKVYAVSQNATSLVGVTVTENAAGLTLNLNESESVTFSNPRYDYTYVYDYQIAFTDGQLHTGYFDLNFTGFSSPNDNVAVIGSRVYFFNSGAIEITRKWNFTDQTKLQEHDMNITFSNLVLNESGTGMQVFDQAVLNQLKINKYNIPYWAYSAYSAFAAGEIDNGSEPWANQRIAIYGQFPSVVMKTSGSSWGINSDDPSHDFIYLIYLKYQWYPGIEFRKVSDDSLVEGVTWTMGRGNPYIVIMKIPTNNNWIYPKLTGNSIRVIPIYCGALEYMPDDLADWVGINNKEEITQPVDTKTDEFNNLSNQINNIETGYNNDLNENLNNIDFDSNFQSEQNFISSSNFVITVFNGLINNNPLSKLIIVMSILGLAALIIGRKK